MKPYMEVWLVMLISLILGVVVYIALSVHQILQALSIGA